MFLNLEVKNDYYNFIQLSNDLIIAVIVVVVPITRANKPKTINNEFFTIIMNFEIPDFVLTKTNVSMTAGSTMPSNDRQKAPNNEINKSNFGIATANKTENRKQLLIGTDARILFKNVSAYMSKVRWLCAVHIPIVFCCFHFGVYLLCMFSK